MKNALIVLASEMTSIICAVFAGVLAYQGQSGWGWFLAVSLLTAVTSAGSASKGGNESC